MASTSETGHAKNVANFHDLITHCQGFGTSYSPTKTSLKIANLLTQKTTAQTLLAAVIPKKTAFEGGEDLRVAAFDGLPTLSTRVVNALASSDATDATVANANTYNKKIQGSRNEPEDEESSVSASQMSYDQLIQHFEGLISVVSAEPSYNPNEVDLKVTNLNAFLTNMKQKNDALAVLEDAVKQARIQRNNHLYNPNTGLVETAKDVKKYVKSVFTANSPQFELVNSIKFRVVPD